MIPVAIKKRTFIVCINPFDAKWRRHGLLRTAYIQDQTTQNVQSDLESRASVCLLKPIRYKNLSMILFSAFDRGPAVVLRADKLDPHCQAQDDFADSRDQDVAADNVQIEHWLMSFYCL